MPTDESAVSPIVPPSQVTGLIVTRDLPTSISLAWNPPKTGTPPFAYTVFMRVHGAMFWAVVATTTQPSVVITKLQPRTEYDFEVMAYHSPIPNPSPPSSPNLFSSTFSNAFGSGLSTLTTAWQKLISIFR